MITTLLRAIFVLITSNASMAVITSGSFTAVNPGGNPD
jgi:hypothetical protein